MKYVKSEKAISTKHDKLGELELSGVETPQYESLEEFVAAAGGSDDALEFINGVVDTNAKNIGRAALRNLPDNADTSVAFPRILDAIKNYSPKGGERATTVNKKKAQAFDAVESLLSSGKPVTLEDLQKLMLAAK